MKVIRSLSALALLCLLALPVLFAPSQAAEKPPHASWLAYEGRIFPASTPLVGVLYMAPEIALFQDGRLIWLDVNHWRAGEGQNPCAWRTAVLSVRERIDFKESVQDSEFFTIMLPPDTASQALPRSGETFLGVHLPHKTRQTVLAARYVPESEGSRRYMARMHEVLDALRALTQRSSECYRPDVIRVVAFQADPSTSALEWPATVAPGLTRGKPVEFHGDEAHKIIDALAVSTLVTIDGQAYKAAWAPVLDVPSPVVTPTP